MKDEMDSAETNPTPPTATNPAPPPPRVPPDSHALWRWVKRLLVCNPFYLLSAALLLFGLYRVSIDPHFLTAEVAQLTFNSSSLQGYELLLVGTAIVLARRRIWYDATLLVVLENLLVLVPFMLISQAALVEQRTGRLLCATAAMLVIGRSLATRRWVAALEQPPRLLAIGLGVLLVNSAWPVIYRFFQETKVGKKMTSGAAYEMNELSWFWLLPALCALAYLLPRPRADGELPAQRRWFPVLLCSLWLAGSGVHLYALGYIYDFDLRLAQLAPALWVLAWVLHLRLPDYVKAPAPAVRKLTLILPLPVSLLAAHETGSHVFLILSALNLLAYAGTVWRERGNRLALHLLLISLAAAFAALPVALMPAWVGAFVRTRHVELALLAYLMVAAMLTRFPPAAILGGMAAGIVGGAWLGHPDVAWYWAAQAGQVFFLLHSLRWRDYEHPGVALVRGLVAAGWVIHSFIWLGNGAAFWHPLAMAGALLFVWWLRGFVFLRWSPWVVPGAAVLVALCGPAKFALQQLQTTPIGVTAILGSFLLFALGTALALTKHRWHKNGTN